MWRFIRHIILDAYIIVCYSSEASCEVCDGDFRLDMLIPFESWME
jgi:hypothetical protein